MVESKVAALIDMIGQIPEDIISDCTITLKNVDSGDLFELHKVYGSKTFKYRKDKLITIPVSKTISLITKTR